MHISIALATFNGEKYLQEQLDSFLRQSYLPYELQVGDDGSTDSTLDILYEFARHSSFPVNIVSNNKKLGYGENFLRTAFRCSGDWIAFSDQDDVWLSHKLQQCADTIDNCQNLNLILQSAELCDELLVRSGRIFPNAASPGIYGPRQQYGFWVWPGFLQTVRGDLIRSVKRNNRPHKRHSKHIRDAHDNWTCMLANALGGICVLDGVSALYRRHGQTVTGGHARLQFMQAVNDARLTGAKHYLLRSKLADHSNTMLRKLSEQVDRKEWRSKFAECALQFAKLSQIYRTRASLYQAVGFCERLKLFLSIWREGGYLGARFAALGIESAAKDAVVVCFGAKQVDRAGRCRTR
jgi:glycosyltransferase involved in cell wall biosynthesis